MKSAYNSYTANKIEAKKWQLKLTIVEDDPKYYICQFAYQINTAIYQYQVHTL